MEITYYKDKHMTIDKRHYLLILLLLTLTAGLVANSVFSFYGMPHQDYSMDVYSIGMGDAGIADVYRKNTSFVNPSLAVTLNQVYFSTGITAGLFNHQARSNQNSQTDGAYFPYFNVTVPISDHRLGFNFSPYLSGNTDVYSLHNDWSGMTFEEVNKVRSYVYKASVFYAQRNRIVNFGVSLNYYLGHRFQAWTQKFSGETGFIDAAYELNETFRNPGLSLGINKAYGDFSIAAVYSNKVLLDGKKELVTKHSIFPLQEKQFEIPDQIGVGIVYRISDTFRFATDFIFDRWSETSYYDNPRDCHKISAGFAYEPIWGKDQWYRKIPFRFGASYRTLPFSVDNNSLDEIGGSFGFTIPLQSPNNQLEFAVKHSIRGSKDDIGYSEKSTLFSIGLSGFDFFRSRPRRIDDRDIPKAEFEGFR